MVLLVVLFYVFFFFKQKTAYEMRISDWSSDVCSSDLGLPASYRQGTHHLHLGGAPGRGAEPLRRGLNGVTTMAENLRRAAAERCFVAREAGPMPRFSFEYFPPAAPAAEERFRDTVRRLGPLAQAFVSVTYELGRASCRENVGLAG